VPLYIGGLRLDAAYPLGPILEGAGVNISVVSYADSIDIGVIACPRAIDRPHEVTSGFEAAVDRLLGAAREHAAAAACER
jgi:hypothetical protein